MSSSVFRNLLHLRKSDVKERVAPLTNQILVTTHRGIVSNDKIAELISFQEKKTDDKSGDISHIYNNT